VQVGDIKAYQDQSSGPNQSAGNIAYHQSGDDNNGKQDQMGSLNDALIDQLEMITRPNKTNRIIEYGCNLSSWRWSFCSSNAAWIK
jgi:hypothetical protein